MGAAARLSERFTPRTSLAFRCVASEIKQESQHALDLVGDLVLYGSKSSDQALHNSASGLSWPELRRTARARERD
jgi:hypothetical protein